MAAGACHVCRSCAVRGPPIPSYRHSTGPGLQFWRHPNTHHSTVFWHAPTRPFDLTGPSQTQCLFDTALYTSVLATYLSGTGSYLWAHTRTDLAQNMYFYVNGAAELFMIPWSAGVDTRGWVHVSQGPYVNCQGQAHNRRLYWRSFVGQAVFALPKGVIVFPVPAGVARARSIGCPHPLRSPSLNGRQQSHPRGGDGLTSRHRSSRRCAASADWAMAPPPTRPLDFVATSGRLRGGGGGGLLPVSPPPPPPTESS